LEEITWDKIGSSNTNVLRAIWITREKNSFCLVRIHQTLPPAGTQFGISISRPAFYKYDEGQQRFYQSAGKHHAISRELSDQHSEDRAFFAALSLLRALSPGPGLEYKPDPFPAEESESQGSFKIRIAIRPRAAHVSKGTFLASGKQVLTVRGQSMSTYDRVRSNEVFDLNSAPIHSHLAFESDCPWKNVDGASVRAWVDQNMNFSEYEL